MTEEQQKPVIKITDHYFTDEEIKYALQQLYIYRGKVYKDNTGFYWREETEI